MHGRRCRPERRPRQAPQARARPADAGPVHHLGEARRRPRRVGRGAWRRAPQRRGCCRRLVRRAWCPSSRAAFRAARYQPQGQEPWLLRDDLDREGPLPEHRRCDSRPPSAPEVPAASARHIRGQRGAAVAARRRATPVGEQARHHHRPRGRAPASGPSSSRRRGWTLCPPICGRSCWHTGKIAPPTRSRPVLAREDNGRARAAQGHDDGRLLTADERGFWNARFKQTRQILAQGTFSRARRSARVDGLNERRAEAPIDS